MKVARLTISDRASTAVYQDRSGPVIDRILREWFGSGTTIEVRLIPDEQEQIGAALRELADLVGCALVITTGGTGPAPRDVTPEATREVIERELPGFGELMRLQAFERVRTAILSRGLAGVRGQTLIINLPGSPKAVEENLRLLRPAIQEALQLIRGEDPHAAATTIV